VGYEHSHPGPVGIRLGLHVSMLRVARGWTQADLANAVAEYGRPMHTETVGRIERGTRKVDVDDLHALAYAFRMTASALLRKAAQ
jgi:transcriptional regulator with XRE-family HTH domain